MNPERALEREIDAYLEARATARRPDALLASTLARVDRTGQRAGWLVPDRWASPSMQTQVRSATRLLALAALIVAISLVGVALIVAIGSRPRLPRPFGLAANGLIAFDANGAIVVANSDGSRRHALTVGPAIASDPTWSPDGTRIAYFVQPGRRQPGALFVADADGSHASNVSAALSDSVPLLSQPAAWSPDGRELAFTAISPGAANGDPHLVVVGVDGTGLRRIGPPAIAAEDPAWSPDGTRIAFKGQADGIDAGYVLELETGIARRITTTTVTSGSYGDPFAFRDLQWSPDGSRILFFVTVGSGNHDIFVVNSDGTGEHDLTNTAEDEEWPTWSPDGRLIAFDREYTVVVMNADATGQRVLASDLLSPGVSRPRWSPDGSKVLVYTSAAGDTVEVLDLAGGAPIVMPAPGGATGISSWQRVAAP